MANKRTILIVDDDAELREALVEQLALSWRDAHDVVQEAAELFGAGLLLLRPGLVDEFH